MPEKLSVCHCLISGGFGGIQRMVDILTQEQSYDCRVGVVFAMAGGPFADSISSRGVPTCFLGLKSGFDMNPRALFRLRAFYKNYDIVHVHSFNYPFIIVALLMRKKVVFTVHSMTSLRRGLSLWDRIKNASLNFLIGRGITRVTTVSEFMKTVTQREYSRARDISVVYNCIQQPPKIQLNPDAQRNKLGLAKDKFVVLTYCTMVHNKRVALLLDALIILSKQNRSHGIRCLIVGDGPHRSFLEKYAAEHGIADWVTFKGYTDSVYEYIALSDLCVFPSKDESFGLTVLEALSMGKVAIVFRDGGGMFEIVETLPERRFVVADAAELAQRIYDFAAEPEQLHALSSQCRELAAKFSPAVTVAGYSKVYQSCFTTH